MLAADDFNVSLEKLSFINSLQRLGVACHFEEEIAKALEHKYEAPDHGFDDENGGLFAVGLRFRLLRQQGYNIPCDVFNRFKNRDGKFKEGLNDDVIGMLSLYEATHLRVRGEDILDEALKFTTTRLRSLLNDDLIKPQALATQVIHALKRPLHKGYPRLEALHYITVYKQDKSKNEILLKLAVLDFNLVQSIHQQELSQLSKWWKELGITSKLPYARDRLVEMYFWMVGVFSEPQYALARKISTRFTVLASIVDDTYDAYGTLEELELFTDAIQRWDPSAMDGLPAYMKVLYSALLDVHSETEDQLRKEGQAYRINYVKEVMKSMTTDYLMEAKWFNDGYVPTFEEYVESMVNTGGVTMVTVYSLVGMGDTVTKEAFDWTMSETNKLFKASNLINRLMDDMVSHKFEQERGHTSSAVECYMKQYNVSEKEACDEFNSKMEDAWKHINEECLNVRAALRPVILRCINLIRLAETIYKDKDGYTLAHEVLKDHITSLFVDPMPMH